ncbi:MAG TPA: DUF481 domain-containing protein [Gemmatimonadales bacterium]|nr:DUF481 domain-containing protein [Gemmatimonadales bacterium]
MTETRRGATRWSAWRPLALAAVLVPVLLPSPAAAQKTDVVVLRNGDRITGEVKGLAHGLLDYSTDDVGRLKIEWTKILRITSREYYEVEVASGRKHFGRFDPPAADGMLLVALQSTADTLPIDQVVGITPIGSRFVSRLQAWFDLGFTLAKAQWATTLTSSGEVRYRDPTVTSGVTFSSYFQKQEDVDATKRISVQLDAGRFVRTRDLVGVLLLLERNDELGLARRITVGAGAGRTLARSNTREVSIFLGLVVSGEETRLGDPAGASDTTTTNLEGLASLSWSAFRYDQPRLDFSADLALFPGFAEGGGIRANLDARLKYELFHDFNVGLSFSDAYDSNPAGSAGARNDFVTSVTIGWSYRR